MVSLGHNVLKLTFNNTVRLEPIFFENVWIIIQHSLKFGAKGPIDNKWVLTQVYTAVLHHKPTKT